MDGSLLQLALAVFTAMLLQTWYLQREIRRSREESIRHADRSHDQLRADFAEHKTDTKDSFDQLRADFAEHKTDTKDSFDQLRADFAEHKTDTKDSFDQLRDSHDRLRTDFQRSHDQLRTDFEKNHDQLRADFAEHKDITERNHRETQRQLTNLAAGLGDARERLARIEGYLRIGLPEPPEAAASG